MLVNNAGINHECPSESFTAADFDKVLAVNLRGVFLCSREAIKLFLKQGSGVIINNSSNHELVPKPGFIAPTRPAKAAWEISLAPWRSSTLTAEFG